MDPDTYANVLTFIASSIAAGIGIGVLRAALRLLFGAPARTPGDWRREERYRVVLDAVDPYAVFDARANLERNPVGPSCTPHYWSNR